MVDRVRALMQSCERSLNKSERRQASASELIRWYNALPSPISRAEVWRTGFDQLEALAQELGGWRSERARLGLSLLIDCAASRGLHAAELAGLLERPAAELLLLVARVERETDQAGMSPGPSVDGRAMCHRRRRAG